ncbi:hypothetical protein [Sphingomonas bacterium]|uniref:hypothetical protein n=1 Tax=Sphingomonas bacterium TaxID=1895847 RepID=UPI00157766B5|nr:hypothetical protein [Sphingomonas bacterium]
MLLLSSASASAMPTSMFIARWQAASHVTQQEAQKATTSGIANSAEMQALIAEFSTAGSAYRQQILDARAAGRTPRACPPKDVNITVNDVIAEIARLPTSWQSRELSDSFGAAMDRRFPCPGPNSK